MSLKNIFATILLLSSIRSTNDNFNPELRSDPYSKKSRDYAVEQAKLELSSTSYYKIGTGTLLPPHKEIGDTNPAKPETKEITANDLVENSVSSMNSLKGITVNETFDSDGWRGANAIGRFYRIKVTTINRITGIYSHFGSYFDRSILESGSAQTAVEVADSYSDTYSESLSYKETIDLYAEAKMEAKLDLDVASLSAGFGEKIGASYTYGCTYTRNKTENQKWSTVFSLSKDTARYCPSGYGLSIGKEGTYYLLSGEYQEYSHWWWGNYPTQGSSRKYFSTVSANPANFIYCFAYKLKSDTDRDFYQK